MIFYFFLAVKKNPPPCPLFKEVIKPKKHSLRNTKKHYHHVRTECLSCTGHCLSPRMQQWTQQRERERDFKREWGGVIQFFESLIKKIVIREIKADSEIKHDRLGEAHSRCITQQVHSRLLGHTGVFMGQGKQ